MYMEEYKEFEERVASIYDEEVKVIAWTVFGSTCPNDPIIDNYNKKGLSGIDAYQLHVHVRDINDKVVSRRNITVTSRGSKLEDVMDELYQNLVDRPIGDNEV